MGYCAKALSAHLSSEQWSISGTSRQEPDQDPGYRSYAFSGTAPMRDGPKALNNTTHMLISAAPDANGDPVLNWHRKDIAALRSLKWLGYLSTTGVYGNTDGKKVDETAVTRPSSRRSEYRLKAELAWLDLMKTSDVPVHIFRLPGIYGPGRSALNQVQTGKARRIDKPGHQFSRIHVDDIANTLLRSIETPNPGRIYNVCDNEAASPADVTAFACDLLGAPTPDMIPYDIASQSMSPMALSFWQDNRRVDNTRILTELGVKLAYPTYREGLTAIHQASET